MTKAGEGTRRWFNPSSAHHAFRKHGKKLAPLSSPAKPPRRASRRMWPRQRVLDRGELPKRGTLICLTTGALCALGYASVANAATAEEAKAFAEKAVAHIKQVGEEKAFADFTRRDGGYVQGELYVFCYDHNGVNKAHGANPAFVGKNLLHVKDPDGKEPNAEIIKLAWDKGEGWVNFKWPDPVTKKIEDKSAYVIHVNDVACGVGYYKKQQEAAR